MRSLGNETAPQKKIHFELKNKRDRTRILPVIDKIKMSKSGWLQRTALIWIGLMLLTVVGCGGPSYRFYKATWFGQLKPGMSKDAVREILGDPTGVERRQMPPDELREVWIYHIKNLNPQNHLYPTIRMIVFSNGTMVAQDPSDPYAPQLRQ
jgi:hypothetical protein